MVHYIDGSWKDEWAGGITFVVGERYTDGIQFGSDIGLQQFLGEDNNIM